MQLIEILTQRLQRKGLEPSMIPGFIRSVSYSISGNQHVDLKETNRRLYSMGWYTIELDYHTLQLIMASFEWGGE
jgi:hypothetical protein